MMRPFVIMAVTLALALWVTSRDPWTMLLGGY